MLKIGLTGGIGSGKSTVAKVFQTLGVPVYDADATAKKIMNENAVLKEQLMAAFGEETYSDGPLNKVYLSTIVFGNEAKLKKLNSIVHPIVIKAGEDWMAAQTTTYAIKEAAIFFESGSAADLDYMIGVYAPQPLRIFRSIKRDNSTRQQVQARMDQQLNEEIKMKLCDFVINNDEQQLLLPQVLALHERFLLEAKKLTFS